jgi:predicted Zn-dependent protease with MMP-like domain
MFKIQFVPHRKHYVSATEPNGLMLFRETVAVYCENHTEHTDTLWAEYIAIQSVPHRKHSVSITKPNRLMLFRETVAAYCENHTEHTDTLCGQNEEFYLMLKQVVYTDTTVLHRLITWFFAIISPKKLL